MSVKSHKHFVSADCLASMQKELLSSAGWIFRGNCWRYYLLSDLVPYIEDDPSTWYHHQRCAMDRIPQPWKHVFDKVCELAGPKFKLMRYAINGQTQNQVTKLHKDVETLELPGHWCTYLIYLNTDYDQAWGGPTQILMPTGLWHQEWPEPGKLIEYDSQLWHIGRPPEISNVLRLTLALQGHITE
jgi:hypothetical protein